MLVYARNTCTYTEIEKQSVKHEEHIVYFSSRLSDITWTKISQDVLQDVQTKQVSSTSGMHDKLYRVQRVMVGSPILNSQHSFSICRYLLAGVVVT